MTIVYTLCKIDSYIKKIQQTPPPEPNTKIDVKVMKKKLNTLIYGYIHQKYENNKIFPKDIMQLLFNLVYFNDTVNYKQVLNALLNEYCCIGVYYFKMKMWRPAVYIKHWEKTKKIMVGFVDDHMISNIYNRYNVKMEKYCIITDFPVNYVILDFSKFFINPKILKHQSYLSTKQINIWIKKYYTN